jgi:hypothetical protein
MRSVKRIRKVWGVMFLVFAFLLMGVSVVSAEAYCGLSIGRDGGTYRCMVEPESGCPSGYKRYTSREACGTAIPGVSVLYNDPDTGTGGGSSDSGTGGGSSDSTPCSFLSGSGKSACESCLNGGGFWTAIGCLSVDPPDAVASVFGLALGLGGVFIVFQILMGAFGLITSGGNPQAVQKARGRIVNSIVALLFVVFSFTILEIIMIQVLRLPGAGGS